MFSKPLWSLSLHVFRPLQYSWVQSCKSSGGEISYWIWPCKYPSSPGTCCTLTSGLGLRISGNCMGRGQVSGYEESVCIRWGQSMLRVWSPLPRLLMASGRRQRSQTGHETPNQTRKKRLAREARRAKTELGAGKTGGLCILPRILIPVLSQSVCFVVQSLGHIRLFAAPGTAVRHLPEFSQIHVHWVSDAVQPSHPLMPPSPPHAHMYFGNWDLEFLSQLHAPPSYPAPPWCGKITLYSGDHSTANGQWWDHRQSLLRSTVKGGCCPRGF